MDRFLFFILKPSWKRGWIHLTRFARCDALKAREAGCAAHITLVGFGEKSWEDMARTMTVVTARAYLPNDFILENHLEINSFPTLVQK